jgi:hypothetical protein
MMIARAVMGTDVDKTRRRKLRALLASMAPAAALALVPAGALAAFSVSGLVSAPASQRASAPTDFAAGEVAGALEAHIRVTRAGSDKPRLKLVVRETGTDTTTKIKKTRLRLAKGLRFSGSEFSNRFVVKPAPLQVGAAPHKVIVVMNGTSKVVEKAARGALMRQRAIAGRRLHFQLVVVESGGVTTHLDLTTRAKA